MSSTRTPAASAGLASPLILLAFMWAIRLFDAVLPADLSSLGVRAWDFSRLCGIAASPLLHTSWSHLAANTAPFAVLGCLIAAQGTGRFWFVTAVSAAVSGIGVFVLNLPGTVTIGASGLVFGYFGYTIAIAFFSRTWSSRLLHAGIGLAVIVVYGSTVLTGLVPVQAGVSWQGHLTGALGGVLAAVIAGRDRTRSVGTAPAGTRVIR